MRWSLKRDKSARFVGQLLFASLCLMSCSNLNGKIDFKSLRATQLKASLAWNSSIQDIGLVPINNSISLSLTLTNSGTSKATECTSPILSGANGAEFQILTDNCATSDLAAAATCTVVVASKPTSAGAKAATLTRTCTQGGTASAALTAEGLKPLSGAGGVMVAAGQKHTCALLADGNVKCWGYNGFGQLGIDSTVNQGTGSPSISTLSTVNLGSGKTATQIALGFSHTCALLKDGNVKCWGENTYGKLGQGNTSNAGCGVGASCTTMATLSPINLGAGVTATQIAAGASHTCAILNNGSVKCWGFNNNGQLGQSNTTTVGVSGNSVGSLPSIDLGLTSTAIQIVAGGSHTCALLNNLTVKCWGWNYSGELGQNTNTNVGDSAEASVAFLPPINFGTNFNPVRIIAGGSHNCALSSNGAVKCWGNNDHGQLGQNHTTHVGCGNTNGCPDSTASISSIDLGTGLTAIQLASRGNHTCALLKDGTMKCWGMNTYGELGQDNTTLVGDSPSSSVASVSPINLGLNKTATHIAVGAGHTCAVLNDGTIKCWGYNDFGQLGQDNFTPVGNGGGALTLMGNLSPIVGLF